MKHGRRDCKFRGLSQFNFAPLGLRNFPFHQKHQHRITYRYLVAMAQFLFVNSLSVYESSVAAAEITDCELSIDTTNRAMLPGQCRVGNPKVIRGLTPDRNFRGNRDSAVLQ